MSNTRSRTRADANLTGMADLKIGGKRRQLRFDGRALYRASTEFGLSDVQHVMTRAATLDYAVLAQMTWCGLLHAEPDLDFDEVLDWIGPAKSQAKLSDLLEPVLNALTAAIGDDEDEEKDGEGGDRDRPTKPPAGTGGKRSAPRSPRG